MAPILKRSKQKGVMIPLNPIRVERELSKFPVHNLVKRTVVNIDIRGKDRAGREFRWQVSPSRNHGEPKELAYKLDTLLINRRIEEAGTVKPKVVKLGSLRSICEEIGLAASGKNTNDIKNALRQNANTAITAKIQYIGRDRVERSLEADFTRYSVITTGETLPNGQRANAVYLILNDIYREVLNNAGTRPLDYSYLKILPPTAQRFYELVSPQIFAAIKYKLPCAKYRYSDFCTYSALTRYVDWERARKQMYKVIVHHKKSSYLKSVTFQETTDDGGQPDWWICLVPGSKARDEFKAFQKKANSVLAITELTEASPVEVFEEEELGSDDAQDQKNFEGSFLWDLVKSTD